MLHSTAAYFPDEPTEGDKQAARQFVDYFMRDGIEYEDWGNKFMDSSEEEGPIDVSSRKNFSVWMCKQHNKVNFRLQKPEFSCEWEDLRKRWGPM